MERLNQLIEEYVMEKFEEHREAIDDMYKKYEDMDEDEDEDEDVDDATNDLQDWLFRFSELGHVRGAKVSIIAWLRSVHKDYFVNFWERTTSLEMLEILEYIRAWHEDDNEDDDDQYYLSYLSKELKKRNQIEKTKFIITEYSLAWYGGYGSKRVTYSSILDMIESRVIPK
jgi:hypothetical protein